MPRPKRSCAESIFDLIGLPPTLEQLGSFLNDESTDAYEKIVDQLLSDPQHGARFANFYH